MITTRNTTRSARRTLAPAILVLALLAPLGRAGATVGDHPKSETPGSQEAVIFSAAGWGDADAQAAINYVDAKLTDHNYDVVRYIDSTEAADDDPQSATAANFLNVSGAGVVYVLTHGHSDALFVESYQTEAIRDLALTLYQLPRVMPPFVFPPLFAAGELRKCKSSDFQNPSNDLYAICITDVGIRNHFADNNTIVHVASCKSWDLKDDFQNAREYFGYQNSTYCDDVRDDTERLWGRMHGEKLNGTKRAAKVAYAAGGFHANFKHQHRAGALETVLSPAVQEHRPGHADMFVVPVSIPKSFVEFDTKMDTGVPAASVLELVPTGCGGAIKDATWVSDYKVEFTLELNGPPGAVILKVKQATARAQRTFKNNLDGNDGIPGNPPHIGPNRDDYAWKVGCIPG